jgi:hypothetical protein
MDGTSEKREDIQQYELDALIEIRKNWSELEGGTAHTEFVKGTTLGLGLGIVGSLFVLFLCPVGKAVMFGEYGPAYVDNLIVCGISLALVIFISIMLLRQLRQDRHKLESSRKILEVIDYAIRRRQYSLGQGKKEHQPTM